MFVREERVNSPIKAAKPCYGLNAFEQYGVDGTIIGMSKRVDGWSFQLDPARRGPVRNLTIFHTTKPDVFQFILNSWVAREVRWRVREFGEGQPALTRDRSWGL